MSQFEVISVDLYKGRFATEVVDGTGPVDVMMSYFKEDEEELRVALEKDIEENPDGGWYLKNEEETFIIRQIS